MFETIALSALFLCLLGLLFERERAIGALSRIPLKELGAVLISATLRLYEIAGEALIVVAVVAIFFSSFAIIGDLATAIRTLFLGIVLIYTVAIAKWLIKKKGGV